MTKNEYSLSKIIIIHSICFFYLIFLKHILLPIDTFISFEQKFLYLYGVFFTFFNNGWVLRLYNKSTISNDI